METQSVAVKSEVSSVEKSGGGGPSAPQAWGATQALSP